MEKESQTEKEKITGAVYPGQLIAFEGIDGTGKTTQVRLLCEALRGLNLDVIQTREPTDGEYGRKIRMLYKCRDSVTPEEELALFLADRREHVAQVIGPALAAGKVVVTDRYYYSTAAYQGAGGRDPEAIISENETFAPAPDLVILLEAPVRLGLHRVESLRGEQLNDFEQEDSLSRVAAIFAKLRGANIERIDGTRPAADVHRAVLAHVFRLLRARGKNV